jgi:hypothetical protein
MGFEDDPGRETRNDDQEALDEIHRLFVRNRETAHHGQVTEHDESPELRVERPDQAPAPPRR